MTYMYYSSIFRNWHGKHSKKNKLHVTHYVMMRMVFSDWAVGNIYDSR